MKLTAQISLALFIVYFVLYYYTTPTTFSDDLVVISTVVWLGSYAVLVYQALKA
jgi:hypothetical protein